MHPPPHVFILAGLCLGVSWCIPIRAADDAPTFHRDVAPVIFANCVSCHHPDGDAPFPLTTFEETKKHAQQIVEVTGSRFMPPWLPEKGHGEFAGERRLTKEQIKLLARWSESGAAEGDAADLKEKPVWPDGWKLGKPDLVIEMPEAYELPADGHDVYRNFVIRAPVAENRFVVAAELRPGSKAVHHAFLKFDRRGGARRLDARDKEPGYPGMNAGTGIETPSGSLSSWQPGHIPRRSPDDMAWLLPGGADIVLQMHLQPTGKPEQVKARVGLYFTQQAPTRFPVLLCIRSTAIDIPPGSTDHPIESAYTLPVDGEVLSVLPHLHYLGKEIHAWAEFPDGTKVELLLIKQWDFNWQGDYRYVSPVFLPKGTTVRMRYTYDNSDSNPRNQSHPPVRVRYGTESTDEMGEFWMQFLPRNNADVATLRRDYIIKFAMPDEVARLQMMLERDPRDAVSRADFAAVLLGANRSEEARAQAEQALKDDPHSARAQTVLGNYWIDRNQLVPARTAFAAAVASDPDDGDTRNNLGWLLFVEGRAADAIPHLEKALELRPDDALAKQNLEKARAQVNSR
jgi:mono/diheme cytochrome c family protein